jgi:hypothetical protein
MIETNPRPARLHYPSLFLTLLSGLGLLIGFPAAVLLGVFAVTRPAQDTNRMILMILAWAAGLFALLNLPALIYSAPRVFGYPAPGWKLKFGWRLSSIALVLWVVDLAAASWLVGQSNRISQLFLPPLSVLAVAIPLWWLVEFGRRGLNVASQRSWGAVSLSLVVMMPVVLVLELIGFFFLGVVIMVGLVGTAPDLLPQLSESFTNGARSEIVLNILEPYLNQPWVILAGMSILTIFGPLLEELLKPLALWFVPGRRLTEAQGFVLGLIVGGCFALLETIGNLQILAGQSSTVWITLLLTRAGTGLLHITCSGLVGWGLASAWHAKRYWRLLKLYLLAVLIHGSWNLCAQLIGLGARMPDNGLVSGLALVAPFFMFGLIVAMFVLLQSVNRRLNAQQIADQPVVVVPEPVVPLFADAVPVPLTPEPDWQPQKQDDGNSMHLEEKP